MSDCNCDPKGGILALILALVMALSLVACGGGNVDADKDGNEKMKSNYSSEPSNFTQYNQIISS